MPLPALPTLPGLAFPIMRRPIFANTRLESLGGINTRLAQRNIPKHHWEIDFEFLRQGLWSNPVLFRELDILKGFFLGRSASLLPFSYLDDYDSDAVNQAFGTGNGTATRFQLLRTYANVQTQPVYVPLSWQIYSNGTLVSPSAYSVSSPGGVVTFTAAPAAAAVLTWNGAFAWLCRFDDDQLDFVQDYKNMFMLKGLKFTSELLP